MTLPSGDNKVQIIFEGIDHVTPVANKITGDIAGTGGEAGLTDLKAQFAEALKPTESYNQALKDLEETSKSTGFGLDALAIGVGVVVAGVVAVGKAIEDVVDLSKEKPELFSEEQIQNIYAYQNATNELKDAWTELKIELVSGIIPAVTDVSIRMAHSKEVQERAIELMKEGRGHEAALAQAAKEVTEAYRDYTPVTEDAADATKSVTDATRELNRENETLLANMFKIQSTSEKFIEGEEKRAEKEKELQEEKVRLALEQQKTLDDGNLTQEKRNDYVVKQVELDKKLADLQKEGATAIEDKEKATKKLIYSQLEAKAAADGLVDSNETEFLQNTAVQMGLVDRASADMAIAVAQAADEMWAAFENPQNAVTDLQDRLDAIVKGGPYRTQIIVEEIIQGGGSGSTSTAAINAMRGRSYNDQMNLITQEVTQRQSGGGRKR